MRLSESEARSVKKWERRERDWRWQRWVWLGMCSLLLVVFTLVFRWFVMAADEERATKLLKVRFSSHATSETAHSTNGFGKVPMRRAIYFRIRLTEKSGRFEKR